MNGTTTLGLIGLGPAREEPVFGAVTPSVSPQFCQQAGGEEGETFLVALALADADLNTIGEDVIDAQMAEFTDAQAGGIGGREPDAVAIVEFGVVEEVGRSARD